MDILFIDACPRTESRTRRLAMEVLQHLNGNIVTLKLSDIVLPDIDEAAVNTRMLDGRTGNFEAPVYQYAKQFAAADCIVIAAPFWDLSFPAMLKKYIEAISVTGITFRYSEEGIPIGLCKASYFYYVTTAGGIIFDEQFGYGYLKTMAQAMYGIPECCCFKAENLDVYGVDGEAVLKQSADRIKNYFEK